MSLLTEYLCSNFEEIYAEEFYRDIFSYDLQEKGVFDDGKYNGILVEVDNSSGEKKILRHTVTNDLDKIREVCTRDNFCLMSPISYVGKARKSENARLLYAIAIDLDGIIIKDNEPTGLDTLIHQIENISRIPKPTYIVSSGTGLHLYYVFEEPIKLYPNIVEDLQKYKRELTRICWNGYITELEKNVQYESLFQGFRVVGTITKRGERARAFVYGDKVDMKYMNEFVDVEDKVLGLEYKTRYSLKEAKEKFPEWYEARIVNKQPRATWTTKRDLYDWWKRRIEKEVKVGHRYYCMMCLAVYARKAGISREELEKDAFELAPYFDTYTKSEDNYFTDGDVLDGLQAYDDKYMTFPINSISKLTDIPIQKNKRNYRKQSEHLLRARTVQALDYPNGEWRKGNGRKAKDQIVAEWRHYNPQGKKIQCHRETGLSRVTIDKHWNAECNNETKMRIFLEKNKFEDIVKILDELENKRRN